MKERDYLYWIIKNCPRQHCWIVLSKLDEILAHEDTQVFTVDGTSIPRGIIPLNQNTMQYVYFAVIHDNKLETLVRDGHYYYYLENTLESEDKYKSIIKYNRNLDDLLAIIPSSKKKQWGLKSRDKAKLKPRDVEALRKIQCVDFIGIVKTQQMELWKITQVLLICQDSSYWNPVSLRLEVNIPK
jgi:hypothetical protein